MNPLEHFGKGWQPAVLDEEQLAEGTWWYDGQVAHSIVLERQRLNYTAADVERFGMFIHELDWDHPVYEITSDGDTYHWVIDGPQGPSSSSHFSSIDASMQHVKKYGRVEIRWLKGDDA